jgi:hypothetical protein
MTLVLNENSYVTIAEADSYFETRIDSAEWLTISDEVKDQALVTSTQLIDDNAWIGSAISGSQALAWPRSYATYYDARLGMTVTFLENEVPARVKVAVYEQALHLVANEDLLAGTTQTFESISVGSISLSDSNNDVGKTPITSPTTYKLLKPLLVKGSMGVGRTWWRAN